MWGGGDFSKRWSEQIIHSQIVLAKFIGSAIYWVSISQQSCVCKRRPAYHCLYVIRCNQLPAQTIARYKGPFRRMFAANSVL